MEVPLQVSAAGSPLGVTLRTVNGASTCVLPFGGTCWLGYEWAPDLDIYLLDPAGRQVAMSRCMLESTNGNCGPPGRFESIGIPSAGAGTWMLRIESFSGAGQYQVDVFGALGTAPPPPAPDPPSAPTGLTASATAPDAVGLAWTDTSSDEDGFTVARCAGAACTDFATVAQVGADVTAWSDRDVVAAATYRYRVRAERGPVASAWSTVASVTTPSVVTAPDAPANLRATEVSTSRVSLAWDASGRAAGYRVYRCEGRRCASFVQQAVVPAGTTLWSDSAVVARSTYSYYVTADNSAGSASSSPISVKTPRS